MKLLTADGKEYSLTQPETTVGRGLQSTFQLNDPRASRVHAIFRVSGSSCMVEDLGSSNGTFVNRQKIDSPHLLRNGDEVIVGDTVFTFVQVVPVSPVRTVPGTPSMPDTRPHRQALPLSEWLTLLYAPFWAFEIIVRDSQSVSQPALDIFAREIYEAICYRNALARDVLTNIALELDDVVAGFAADPRNAQQGLNDVAHVLDTRLTPLEAEGYKQALLFIGKSILKGTYGAERSALCTIADCLCLDIEYS
nr:FHA domain-containing protein [Anaerolineae bacterium]